jgi:hypothetical protein
MYKAIKMLRHSKQLIRVTMVANATEEHFTSTLTSWNNRGSGYAMRSHTKQTVPLQWNASYHITQINRGLLFSVGSAPRPTQLSSASGLESSWQFDSWTPVSSAQEPQWERRQRARAWSPEHEAAESTALEDTADWEGTVRTVVNCRVRELAVAL